MASMVGSLFWSAFWRSWVDFWRSCAPCCGMMRYLVYIFSILCPFSINFLYFLTLKIIDFHKTVIIFEVFANSSCDVNFVVFLWPLGASWGPLGPHFGGLWPPSGASWGRLGEDLGASLGSLEGFLAAKAPKMPPRAPKTPPGGLPDTPRGLPEAPQRHARGVQEAFQRP